MASRFKDESHKLFVGRFLLPEEIEPWILAQNFGSLPATTIFDHHTYRPTLDTWKGLSTLEAIFRYYQSKGWPKGVGPHFFVTDTGVWVATHPRHDGIGVAGYNRRTLHIEIVGDFDLKPVGGQQLINLCVLKGALSKKPGIPINEKHNLFHRDKAAKSCPGKANTKERLIKTLSITPSLPLIEKPRRAVTREEFANALFVKGLPAIFRGPKLSPQATITRHEVSVLVARAYLDADKPTPLVIRDGRPGDPLYEHELPYVLERLV